MIPPPSSRVTKRGPDWLSVATEPCGGGTSDLGSPRGFLEYLGIYRVKKGYGRPLRWAQPTWARLGHLATPRCLVLTSFNFCSSHEASIASFVPKKSSKSFIAFGELLFLHKNNTTVVLLKTVSVRVSSIQIIPKPYRIVVNMAWTLHKL